MAFEALLRHAGHFREVLEEATCLYRQGEAGTPAG
jgi:hypothetical protein